MKRKPLLCLIWLFSACLLPLSAAGAPDSVYIFRFVPHKDMFYVPWSGNGVRLDSLVATVNAYRSAMTEERLPIYVDGYCISEPTAGENLRLAAVRSNRVKSELILRCDITEDCFVTRNYAAPYEGMRNAVVVTLRIPAPQPPKATPAAEPAVPAPRPEPQPEPEPQPVPQSEPLPELPFIEPEPAVQPAPVVPGTYRFALRFNLLRWATLSPDIGVEWRISPAAGVAVTGTWTAWSWKDGDRRYALWNVSPEGRWYLGADRAGYVGVMFQTGSFDYKLGATGRQGDYWGGGFTGGYMLRLGNCLALDFSLGLGYTRAAYDTYENIEGVNVQRASKTKNHWGINRAGVTLVWKIGGTGK